VCVVDFVLHSVCTSAGSQKSFDALDFRCYFNNYPLTMYLLVDFSAKKSETETVPLYVALGRRVLGS